MATDSTNATSANQHQLPSWSALFSIQSFKICEIFSKIMNGFVQIKKDKSVQNI
jgi:hypothetical protein